MDKTADDQSPLGSQQSLPCSDGASPRGQITGPSSVEGNVNVQIPMALYENLLHLVEGVGFANVAYYVIQVLRDEVDRAESDKGTTGYTQREIEVIRKLIRVAECRD